MSVLWLHNSTEVIRIQLNDIANTNFDGTKIQERWIGVRGNSIVINGEFHIIGGSENGSILRWNECDKKFLEIASMHKEAKKLSHFGLIHDKSTHFLLFGGMDYFTNEFRDNVLEYNIKQNKWHKLPISLPHPMWLIACTKAIRGNYVLIFGGHNSHHPATTYGDILIYSLANKTLRVSDIKCPTKSTTWCSATTINDENKDEKIVFGYVRQAWIESEIEDHHFPTYYLLKAMQTFYLNEFVYLLGDEEHWRISTLDIV
eukprot:519862_1